MKKSKFLLLGSVASLASIPFVAAKCGETKEEEKKKPEEGKNPGQNTDPGKNPGQNTDPGKNPGQNTDPGKNPGGDKNPETDKKPEEEKKPEADKPSDKPADKPGGDKNPETDTTPAKPTKIDISKLETNIQNELKNLAKKDVLSEDIIDVLKKVKGLESIRLGDLSKVEFNEEDKKLTIEAHRDSKLITGKYELTAQPGKPGATTQPSGAVQPGKPGATTQPSGAVQPGKPGATTQPSGAVQPGKPGATTQPSTV